MPKAELERHPPAEAVADHVRAFDPELVEERHDRVREEARVVGRAERLVGVAGAGQIDRDGVESGGKGGDGRQHRDLGAAEPVHHDHRRPRARLQVGQAGDTPELQPARLLGAAGRSQEADAGVQVVADVQAPAAECVHAATRSVAMRRQVAASAVSSASGRSSLGSSSRAAPS
jgi:hypothetical protein